MKFPKNQNTLLIVFGAILLSSCFNGIVRKERLFFKELSFYIENFENEIDFERYWSNDSQNTRKKKYKLENKQLKLTTAKGSEERIKIKFNKSNMTFGTYEWKVFVPKMRLYENCSIGAFLYRDDKHELDFEIGSGNLRDRDKVEAEQDELLLFCSSQQNPHSLKIIKIKADSWYTLKLELTQGQKDDYLVKWFLDDNKIHELQLNYGKKFKFEALCSLENIHFIGDKPTTVDNYALFDFFKYNAMEESDY